MDATRPPIGERQRRAILEEIVAGGDTAEKHYLEVKRELNFNSKEDTVKIARFILGAANRSPSLASRNFGGYAVMVIGAQQGGLPGIPAGIEILHIEQKINKFLGPAGPQWELERAPADAPDREVLFILVDPPKDGDPIFLCRAEFQGERANLANGDIYVRSQGQTRKATAADVDALVARAVSNSTPTPELAVTLHGGAWRLDTSPEEQDRYIELRVSAAKHHYVDSPPVPKRSPSFLGDAALASLLGSVPGPSHLSAETFERLASMWEADTRATWQKNIQELAGAALQGLVVTVGNLHSAFLESVRFDLTLENCFGVPAKDPERVDLEKLFPPAVERSKPFGYGLIPPFMAPDLPKPASYPLRWKNEGQNLEITIELDHLRPNTPWTSDRDDLVVITSQKHAASLPCTWRATVRGHHQTFEGRTELAVGEAGNLKALVDTLNGSDDGEGST